MHLKINYLRFEYNREIFYPLSITSNSYLQKNLRVLISLDNTVWS